MKKIYFSFLVPLFLYGQNLEELVNLTIQNKLVDASKLGIEAQKENYESVKSGYMPKLDVGAGYSYTEKERTGVAQQAANAYASLNYLLYDGGKKEDVYDSLKSNIKSDEKSLEALKNDLSLTVVEYYFKYLSLLSQKDAKEQEIEQLEAQYKRLNRFFEAGTTTEDEVQKIISRVENANVLLQEIELDITTILHNLKYLTGNDVNITKGSKISEIANLDKNLRFDIQALQENINSKRSLANAEKSGYKPTITLDNTFSYYDSEYKNSANKANSFYHQNVASANLKWNLFSFGETKHKFESKQKEYLSSVSNFEYEKNKADIDLELALKAYNIANAKIKSSLSTLNAANSAYEVIKSKFENGLIENVAYLESLSEKFDAASQYESSLNDLEIKKANIIYHSGEKIQEYIK